MEAKGIFSGLRVVELASVLAGPSVGQFLAELGAEVIKVENPATAGDVTRGWKAVSEMTGDVSAYFSCINWGKKSLTLDISHPDGKRVLHQLIEHTDMVIASYKPGDAEKLKVDYDALKSIKPDLIYGQITGYGLANPKVGYDAIIQAESGFMSMNGEETGLPTKMPVALMDILAGHHLKEAMLLAYINKLKTGKGGFVTVSLIEAAVASLANQATNWLVGNSIPSRKGSAHPNIAPYGDIFSTSDNRYIILAIGTDNQFNKLCSILNIGQITDRSEFMNNSARVRNRAELNRELALAISKRNSVDLIDRLNDSKVPAGLIQNVKEAFSMDEVEGLLLKAPQLSGVSTFVARFMHLESKASHLAPPPHLGAHNIEILTDLLGFEEDQLVNLRDNGVVI